MPLIPFAPPGRQMRLAGQPTLLGGGVVLFSLTLLGLPLTGLHLAQVEALNRELGKLCSDPPQKARQVCRLHAQLVRGL